ncbi:MAG: S1 RNA-binding domain-containing protein, partial [Rhodothermales bacterium]|nr:S1 RNA-binding domain-containing protein [Rhodothermales bacterium]
MADNQQKIQEITEEPKEPPGVTDATASAPPPEPDKDAGASVATAESSSGEGEQEQGDAATTPAQSSEAAAEAAPVEVAEADIADKTAPGSDNGYEAPPAVGYTGEIVGDVIRLEDLEASPEEEARLTTYDELRALVEKTLTNVSAHEIVTGRVVSIGEKDVVIDIGFKSDGIISKSEFDHELTSGEEVEVYLERIEDYHGQLVLSKSKADKVKRWRRIEDAFENEEVLEGTIVRRIKGGMIVELFEGVEAFLPGSQIDVRPVRDFDAYLEKRMEFKIVKLNPVNENIVVSHKALIEKDLQQQRQKILSTMEPGQILEGTVKNITDFGVFIDLGGVDGLLHIT